MTKTIFFVSETIAKALNEGANVECVISANKHDDSRYPYYLKVSCGLTKEQYDFYINEINKQNV